MNKNGLLFVISGPSGTGKGTVVNKLIESGEFALSVSATTRLPREGEIEGIHYFFKSKDDFLEMAESHEFLEYAEFCGNYYGTPKNTVLSQLELGKDVILEIEVQGAENIKKSYPEAVLIFLAPPNLDELESRLTGRGAENAEKIKMRLDTAKKELKKIQEYDYVVINETVDAAVNAIKAIAESEKYSTARNQGLEKLILQE